MRRLRSYSALLMLVLFGCYYCSISIFQHTHIHNGTSIVHSHMGGGSEHSHTQEQIYIIDILSTFQSDCAQLPLSMECPSILLESSHTILVESSHPDGTVLVHSLRGPPQA